MDTVTEQWLKYSVEADQKCSEAIYRFFTSAEVDYPELKGRLEDGCNKLYRARSAMGQYNASAYGITNTIRFLEETMERLDGFANTMHLAVFQELEEDYGHPYEKAWNIVAATTPAGCTQMVEELEALLSVRNANELMERLDRLLAVDPYRLLMCIWSCAIAQPYSAQLFSRAVAVFGQLFHETPQDNPDIAAACLYVQKRYAGETAVLEEVRKILSQGNWGAAGLRVLASAAQWLQCFGAEKSILQQKLSMNLEMEPVEQARLKALAQGRSNAPALREVQQDEFSFDIGALSWSDDVYKSFFDQLQQRGEALSYALAVRESENNLRIPKGVKLPPQEELFQVMVNLFDDEYEEDARITSIACTAISDAGNEAYTAYMAASLACPDMAVLMRLVKIGKNLSIKCYTLYLPQALPPLEEYGRVLSLKNKLSLAVSGWEASLIDTLLSALQKVLNASPMPDAVPSPMPKQSEGEIIF